MSAPAREGAEGEVYTWENRRGTVKKNYIYRDGSWRQVVLTKEEAKNLRNKNRTNFTLTAFPPPTTNYSSAALRYPDDGSGNAGMTEQSDYVLFQFYEYKPPFQNNKASAGTVAQIQRKSMRLSCVIWQVLRSTRSRKVVLESWQ